MSSESQCKDTAYSCEVPPPSPHRPLDSKASSGRWRLVEESSGFFFAQGPKPYAVGRDYCRQNKSEYIWEPDNEWALLQNQVSWFCQESSMLGAMPSTDRISLWGQKYYEFLVTIFNENFVLNILIYSSVTRRSWPAYITASQGVIKIKNAHFPELFFLAKQKLD